MKYEVINMDGATIYATNDFALALNYCTSHEDESWAILEDGEVACW